MSKKCDDKNERPQPSKEKKVPLHNNDEGRGKKDFDIDWHKKGKQPT